MNKDNMLQNFLLKRSTPNEGEAANVTRRDFLQLGMSALGALAAVEMGVAGVLFLRSRSLEGEFGGVVTAGAVEDFAPDTVTEFEDGNFFLVCTTDGGFIAVFRRCPHLGCTVNWVAEDQKFYCPCHASSFDINGDYQNQLVSRALDTFPVFFEEGMVKVDTARAQMREHSTPEQVSYQQQ